MGQDHGSACTVGSVSAQPRNPLLRKEGIALTLSISANSFTAAEATDAHGLEDNTESEPDIVHALSVQRERQDCAGLRECLNRLIA